MNNYLFILQLFNFTLHSLTANMHLLRAKHKLQRKLNNAKQITVILSLTLLELGILFVDDIQTAFSSYNLAIVRTFL